MEAHHLFDTSSRPDLEAYEDNLIVITQSIHQSYFDGPPSTRKQKEKKLEKLMNRLELLQERFEGNQLLY